MIQITNAAGGNHRHADRFADSASQLQIETDFGAIPIHAGQQNFTGAVVHHFYRPFHRIDAGRLAPAVGENFPAQRLVLGADPLGVNRHHDTLRAEFFRRLAHEFRVEHGGGINAHLIGPRIQHTADILDLADTAAHGQRDEHLSGDLFHHMHHGFPIVGAGGNIQKSQLVRALFVIAARNLHRIPGIADIHELHALDHTPVVHVEAGNDAFGEAHRGSFSTQRRRGAKNAKKKQKYFIKGFISLRFFLIKKSLRSLRLCAFAFDLQDVSSSANFCPSAKSSVPS